MNTPTRHTRFFLKLMTVLVAIAAGYYLAEGLALMNKATLIQEWLHVYDKGFGTLYNVGLWVGGLIILQAVRSLWKRSRKGLFIYMAGKLVLLIIHISGILEWMRLSGKGIQWEGIAVYLLLWGIFPVLFLFHLKYFDRGGRKPA